MEGSLERIELKWQRRVYRKQLKFERKDGVVRMPERQEQKEKGYRSGAEVALRKRKSRFQYRGHRERIEGGRRDLNGRDRTRAGQGKDRGEMKPA
jgi:hypothetical protein